MNRGTLMILFLSDLFNQIFSWKLKLKKEKYHSDTIYSFICLAVAIQQKGIHRKNSACMRVIHFDISLTVHPLSSLSEH